MADRYAVIRNGVVDNVILCEADFDPGDGAVIVQSDEAGPGWGYAAGVFTPAPYVLPEI